jgi:hypothetical protein
VVQRVVEPRPLGGLLLPFANGGKDAVAVGPQPLDCSRVGFDEVIETQLAPQVSIARQPVHPGRLQTGPGRLQLMHPRVEVVDHLKALVQ